MFLARITCPRFCQAMECWQMISQLFRFFIILALGIKLVFALGTVLHFSMKKRKKQSRNAALKVQTDELSE